MFNDKIFENEFFSLAHKDKKVYICVKLPGYNLNDFKVIAENHPRIKLSQFTTLRNAISEVKNEFIEVGFYKEAVEITTSKDRFEAYATIWLSDQEFNQLDSDDLVNLIMHYSSTAGVECGIDIVHILSNIEPRVAFLIAKGTKPIPGEDALIKLYEIEEAKPEVFQDGKVNHYELNLINRVDIGDWLGERIEPKPGTPGRTVFGEIVKAPSGKQERLIYDRKTIRATLDEAKGITTLRAMRLGAVVYENGVLTVSNYLEITGKVSFETGNIDFDGFVDIKGSVEDNFSVSAEHDIQIMGDLGVGAVDTIESRDGSIYIRGGIAGQEKAEINCDGDLFTKFAADCTINCKGTVHIGYYAMNCKIKAKEVVLEAMNSRIIGGDIEADIRVCAGEIGSKAEVLTKIKVKGFDRQAMREEYDTLGITIEKLKQMGQLLKQKIEIYNHTNPEELSKEEIVKLEKMEDEFIRCQKSLKMYTQRKKNYISYLHAKGEGEIKAMKWMYPNVTLRLKNGEFINHKDHKLGITYYLKNDEIVSDM